MHLRSMGISKGHPERAALLYGPGDAGGRGQALYHSGKSVRPEGNGETKDGLTFCSPDKAMGNHFCFRPYWSYGEGEWYSYIWISPKRKRADEWKKPAAGAGEGEKPAAGLKGGFYHEKRVKLGYIPTRRNVSAPTRREAIGQKNQGNHRRLGSGINGYRRCGTAEGPLVDEGELPGIIEK